MFWIYILLAVLGGFLLGMLVHWAFQRKKVIGNLREDHSDPDSPPYMFMELENRGMDKIHRYKSVILKIRLENYVKETPSA